MGMIWYEPVDSKAVDELPELELDDAPVPYGLESYEEQFVESGVRPWPDAVKHQLLKVSLTSASQDQMLVKSWYIANGLDSSLLISSSHM